MLTEQEIEAIAWLPRNGAWRPKPGPLTALLSALEDRFPGCLETRWQALPGRKISYCHHWRITRLGMDRWASLLNPRGVEFSLPERSTIPETWTVIANKYKPEESWVEESGWEIAQARLLVDIGDALMAQRRLPNGTMQLLIKASAQSRKRAA